MARLPTQAAAPRRPAGVFLGANQEMIKTPNARPEPPLHLVTGATGYIGGRLLRALNDNGARVRCMARRPAEVRSRVPDDVDVVRGDVLDPASLVPALAGVHTAYYLIHAMAAPRNFAAEECEGARNFARAARDAGVQRIIYLGGLGTD